MEVPRITIDRFDEHDFIIRSATPQGIQAEQTYTATTKERVLEIIAALL